MFKDNQVRKYDERIWFFYEKLLNFYTDTLSNNNEEFIGSFQFLQTYGEYVRIKLNSTHDGDGLSDVGGLETLLSEAMRDFGRMEARLYVNNQELSVPAILHGKFWARLCIARLLSIACDDIDGVIDLGSGWSEKLFEIWLARPNDPITYFGLEPAASGRRTAELIARRNPAMRYHAVDMDITRLDPTKLPAAVKRPWVLSISSIDKVHELGENWLVELVEKSSGFDGFGGVHVEPLGWQIGETSADAPRPDALAERLRDRPERESYNQDFFKALRKASALKLIEIIYLKIDAMGQEKGNPYTVVEWRRVG